MKEHHDLGYGLGKEFWHKGTVTEAAKAVVEQVKKDGSPYITATHDRNHPRSGHVMQKTGMTYRYSCEEMYQLNFDGNDETATMILCIKSTGICTALISLNPYNSAVHALIC